VWSTNSARDRSFAFTIVASTYSSSGPAMKTCLISDEGTRLGSDGAAGQQQTNYREAIIALTVRHAVPAVYPFRYFAARGGLMSYGTDVAEVFWRAAAYVDRILKGEKPGDLPVQAPTKYELGARPYGAADARRPRRRGDRMKSPLVHHAARRRAAITVARAALHTTGKMIGFCDKQSKRLRCANRSCGNAPFKLFDRQSVIMLLIPHAIKKRTIREVVYDDRWDRWLLALRNGVH